MTTDLAPVTMSDEQRVKALDLIRADKAIGNVAALRKAGVQGTRGQLRKLINEDFEAEAREARGWSVVKAKQTLYDVAVDPTHASWQRANALFLKAYGGPEFRDQSRVEMTGPDGGPMEVTNPDVAAAIDRFTALTDAAIRAATRGAAERPALES